MAVTIVSSREFNQDTGGAKQAALSGPVFITDRGHLSHVFLTFADYQQLTDSRTMVDLLSMPTDSGDIDFEPAPVKDFPIPADLD